MATPTIAQRLAAGLLKYGAEEIKPTTHYRVFRVPGKTRTYYVGKAGALRTSRTGRVTYTANCSDQLRAVLLGDEAVSVVKL